MPATSASAGRASAARAPAWPSASASKSSSRSGARSATASRWRGDGGLVAAGDRAGERRSGAVRGPVLDAWRARAGRASVAVHAGGRGQALGGGLERDEEVRGDRGGGVVGGAVLVGDVERAACPSARGERAGGGQRARRWRRRRRSRRRRTSAPAAGDGHQRVQARTPRGAPSDVEPGGARAVADERGRGATAARRPRRRSRRPGRRAARRRRRRPSRAAAERARRRRRPASRSAAAERACRGARPSRPAADDRAGARIAVEVVVHCRSSSRSGMPVAIALVARMVRSPRSAGVASIGGVPRHPGGAPRGAQGGLRTGAGLHPLPAARRDPPRPSSSAPATPTPT